MFTIFDPEADRAAREALSRQVSYERGEWTEQSVLLHQQAELRNTLRHVLAGSSFYARHLGIPLDAVDGFTLADLEKLPFTTKADLRENGTQILSRDVRDGWVFYETTGTTGKATPCPRDNVDSTASNIVLTVNYASVLRAHPGRHVIGVMGPSELHSTGDAFGEVFRNLGHCVAKIWPPSPVVGYRRAAEVMREFGVSALVCTPGMAMSLAKEVRGLGLSPRHDFDLRFIMVVGELVTPALLHNIGSIWSTTVYNCMYASQEASILAAIRDDHDLRTIPLNNLYEVIDPDTGVTVAPDESGARVGELVVTHLFQGCKPLVRYRTGDMVRLLPPKPGAPYPSETVVPLGRVRDRMTIGGRSFFAYELEQAVLRDVRGCCGYQIVVDRVGERDVVEVTLEMSDAQDIEDVDDREIRRSLRTALDVDVDVRVGDIGSIAQTGALVSWKASRVVDRRAPEDDERRAALAIAAQRDAAR